jgi:hypothetical protein
MLEVGQIWFPIDDRSDKIIKITSFRIRPFVLCDAVDQQSGDSVGDVLEEIDLRDHWRLVEDEDELMEIKLRYFS